MFYVHKYEVQRVYGGAEEGGWWYEQGEPVDGWVPPSFIDRVEASAEAGALNRSEAYRRENEERYPSHSVLAYQGTYYAYGVTEEREARPYPETRPHYE